jgi:aryl-alcohol dehydrogenase-like predicted oxidoreductase
MGNEANQVGLSRLHIIEAAEASLKRLGTDYIDLYQFHIGGYDPADVDRSSTPLMSSWRRARFATTRGVPSRRA